MSTFRLAAALLLLTLSGCASDIPARINHRDQVAQNLEGLKQGLQAGTWANVERFFSPAWYEGYGELRDRMESRFRNEQITDLQFIVNRVLENDGLVNAQVRWHKAWVDRTGTPRKAEGVSEFTLKPQGRSYRILHMSGDRLF
ncbi:MAG: hypothetical protein Q8O33_05385 [Pseudomonadota bacterium]|nr:hypothetical protein [Pseudomonadota bacterium]